MTPWTVTHQAPPSLVFSRQEYWSGLPFPHPGDLPDPGIEPMPLVSPALADRFFTMWPTREVHNFLSASYSWGVWMPMYVHVQLLSHVLLFLTPWTVACLTPLSMGFLQQEYWSGLPFPPPGDLPNPGIKPTSLASPALAGRLFTTVPPGKPQII